MQASSPVSTAAVAGDWVVAEGAMTATATATAPTETASAAVVVVVTGAAGSGWRNVSASAPAGGQVLVRYGWETLPFEYKQAGVYAAQEGFPAGPFVLVTTKPAATTTKAAATIKAGATGGE
jgi:hypothetical protein